MGNGFCNIEESALFGFVTCCMFEMQCQNVHFIVHKNHFLLFKYKCINNVKCTFVRCKIVVERIMLQMYIVVIRKIKYFYKKIPIIRCRLHCMIFCLSTHDSIIKLDHAFEVLSLSEICLKVFEHFFHATRDAPS